MQIRITLYDEMQPMPEANIWTEAFVVDDDLGSQVLLTDFVKASVQSLKHQARRLGLKSC